MVLAHFCPPDCIYASPASAKHPCSNMFARGTNKAEFIRLYVRDLAGLAVIHRVWISFPENAVSEMAWGFLHSQERTTTYNVLFVAKPSLSDLHSICWSQHMRVWLTSLNTSKPHSHTMQERSLYKSSVPCLQMCIYIASEHLCLFITLSFCSRNLVCVSAALQKQHARPRWKCQRVVYFAYYKNISYKVASLKVTQGALMCFSVFAKIHPKLAYTDLEVLKNLITLLVAQGQ